jgi:signal transduction histidine kinase
VRIAFPCLRHVFADGGYASVKLMLLASGEEFWNPELKMTGTVQPQQVILNLIINTVEAMGGVTDGPRELLISTGQAESGCVLVAVRDSGSGLAPATLEHLFEAFYVTKTTGLGIGPIDASAGYGCVGVKN